MITEQDFGLFLTALRFSADKHRTERRKDADATPYINHPIQVAELLWTVGGIRETSALIAALLHDTIEDTGTRPDEIRDQFGETVLDLVLEVTDNKSLPKAERKRLQIELAPHKKPLAKCIKLADFICNLQDTDQSPPVNWPLERIQEYLLWTERVVAGLRGANPALEDRYDRVLASARKTYHV
jgi:GTP diphosphokinase / guanosine-3',5'-bis(diphosphate) 3'-diphosphatase